LAKPAIHTFNTDGSCLLHWRSLYDALRSPPAVSGWRIPTSCRLQLSGGYQCRQYALGAIKPLLEEHFPVSSGSICGVTDLRVAKNYVEARGLEGGVCLPARQRIRDGPPRVRPLPRTGCRGRCGRSRPGPTATRSSRSHPCETVTAGDDVSVLITEEAARRRPVAVSGAGDVEREHRVPSFLDTRLIHLIGHLTSNMRHARARLTRQRSGRALAATTPSHGDYVARQIRPESDPAGRGDGSPAESSREPSMNRRSRSRRRNPGPESAGCWRARPAPMRAQPRRR
jgi:hypothetical protein